MSDQVKITKSLVDNELVVEAELLPGGDLPTAIFVYENTGEETLGEYIGVADYDELKRFQVWNDEAIPIFANKYILHTKMQRIFPTEAIADKAATHLINSVKKLALEISVATPDTQVYDI